MDWNSPPESAKELVDRLLVASKSIRLIPHSALEGLLNQFRERDWHFELIDWSHLVDIACDQSARWYAEFLFSPAQDPNENAWHETYRWLSTWRRYADIIAKRNPEVAVIDDRLIDTTILSEVTLKNIDDYNTRPTRRVAVFVAGTLARLLHALGAGKYAALLTHVAVFPPRTFGRVHRAETAAQMLTRWKDEAAQ